MRNNKTEPPNVATDRRSRFVWEIDQIIIIKASEETSVADAKLHNPAPATDAPHPSKDDTNDQGHDDQQKP